MWNFDEPIKREGTDSIKFDLRKEIFGVADVIPMWVADMDFKTPEFIAKALQKRLRHEIYGYTIRPQEYYNSIIDWIRTRHSWTLRREWISFSPGVVPALNFCTLAFTNPGDSIIIQPPVYYPFYSAVEAHERKLVYNNLINSENRYEMDFNSLAQCIDGRTKMIIISNPHNPVGRCWKPEELYNLADICIKNEILMISDEIHCDLVLPGYTHTPLASLSDEIAAHTVTLTAPSKTFNLAGLSTASVIISNPDLKKTYSSFVDKLHLGGGNIFGTMASMAAYRHGHDWLDALTEYLQGNAELVIDFCARKIPEITPVKPEATYLIWLDCRKLGKTGKELQEFFVNKAGIGMNEGSEFGQGGEGFMRMNLGTPRQVVEQALEQIEKAIASLR
jgi:cysteine-S-conjugate beta-lyase